MKYSFLKFLTSVSMLFLFSSPLFAVLENKIEDTMKDKIDFAISILSNKSIEKNIRGQKIFNELDFMFDYDLMSKISVGSKNWDKMDESQKKEYKEYFINNLKNSYIDKMDLYTNQKIIIKNLDKSMKNRIFVITNVIAEKEIHEIIYKFYKNNENEWLIYDVDVLGVSVIQTYRAQISDILKDGSIEKLMKSIRKEDKNIGK